MKNAPTANPTAVIHSMRLSGRFRRIAIVRAHPAKVPVITTIVPALPEANSVKVANTATSSMTSGMLRQQEAATRVWCARSEFFALALCQRSAENGGEPERERL
jgi:hypothetical protein